MGQPTTTQFINASNYVYQQTSTLPSGLTPLMSNGQPVIASNPSNGFYGQAFVTPQNQVIIAYEGTKPTLFSSFGRGSLSADGAILTGSAPAAFTDAQNFANTVITTAQQQGIDSSNVFVTGHSLGGAEAESVAAATGLSGATFGAPGVPGYTPSGQQPNVVNYVNYGDPVGNYATDSPYGQSLGVSGQSHVGTVQYLGQQADQQSLVDSTSGLNNPVPGEDPSGAFFYAAGAAAGALGNHSLSTYSTNLNAPLQQLSQAGTSTSDAYAVLDGLDAPLGASGTTDLAQASVVGSDQVNSPNFDVTANSDGTYTITQNQAIYNGQTLVSDVIGTDTIDTNPNSGILISATETSTADGTLNIAYNGSTDLIQQSTLTNPDGSYISVAYSPTGAATETDYNAQGQQTGQTYYPAPSPTPAPPSPTPPPPSPAPPPPSPTPPPPSPTPPPASPAPPPASPAPPPASPAPPPASPAPPPASPAPPPASPAPPPASPAPPPASPAPPPASPAPPPPSPVPPPPAPVPPPPAPVPPPPAPVPPPPAPVPPPPAPVPPPPAPVPPPPAPVPPPPSPIPSPAPSPSAVGFDGDASAVRGIHPLVTRSGMNGPTRAYADAAGQAARSPVQHTPAATHRVVPAMMPVALSAARGGLDFGHAAPRSLAEAIARAHAERTQLGRARPAAGRSADRSDGTGAHATQALAASGSPAEVAAAVLRQAIAAHAPAGAVHGGATEQVAPAAGALGQHAPTATQTSHPSGQHG